LEQSFAVTDRTRVRRLKDRGCYDRSEVYKILDEGLVCHVGYIEGTSPRVIPTGYVRAGDNLYLHGSTANRMIRMAIRGAELCVTVTLLDGLVLARSAMHHSMNYRSVVIFGQARLVQDPEEKLMSLEAFVEHVIPGRWPDIRQPSPTELKVTEVIALPLTEASAKIRTGPPIDDDDDYSLDVWAGVIPLELGPRAPVGDARLDPSIPVPPYATGYSRAENNGAADRPEQRRS
jgi:nitroimidazol reductase NimA-like FMN-containing flavoprotein (pyridoxamine 5'-phosphate oxidase superfamily)